MKLTFGRWVAATLIVCLALGTAILPADGTHWIPSWWVTDAPLPFRVWYQRMNARSWNRYEAFEEFVAARDLVSARREFGATAGKNGPPEIRFASNVPPTLRAAFMNELNSERAERVGWQDRGKIGVLVAVDSPLTSHGVTVGKGSGASAGSAVSRVIAPSALTGDRCVAAITLPNTAAWTKGVNVKSQFAAQPLLDACGFYDAFGPPGAAIASELLDTRFSLTRGYATVDHDDPPIRPTHTWPAVWYDLPAARCLSGEDGACWTFASIAASRSLRRHRVPTEWPGGSDEQLVPMVRYRVGAINRLALTLGPDRFARVWRSSKKLEDAYFDETGETWGDYVRNRAEDIYGPYTPGPWTTPVSLALTLLTVLGLVAATLRFGGRPRVA